MLWEDYRLEIKTQRDKVAVLGLVAIGIGAVLFQKKFIPEEISIQDRHDGRSSEIERKATAATLVDALETSTIRRRKLVGMSLGLGLGGRPWFGGGAAGGLLASEILQIVLPP